MSLKFEHGALIAVAGLVSGLVMAAALNPLDQKTISPRTSMAASLRQVVSQPMPPKPALVLDGADFEKTLQSEIIAKAEGAAQAVADFVAEIRAKVVPELPKMAGVDTLVGVIPASAADKYFRARLMKTTGALSKTFNQLGYDLERVGSGEADVPRLFLASLPGDLKDIRESRVKKSLFFRTVLPLVLQANEEILRDRRRLWNIHFQKSLGLKLGPADRLWMMVIAERYGVKSGSIENLLQRVDIIPPSLALAQAAEESGWGTSRFVREGNAVFGQWTFSDNGSLVPARRDQDKFHKIRAFPSLLESVRAYARNLNTHAAYRKMRRVRHSFRLAGQPLEGLLMVESMKSYSQKGDEYVKKIKTLIEANDLQRLDDARLGDQRPLI
ncbi:MAG: glucosaminidase domain-containing protein [Rhodospirillales bacterium]|nr:glucosaminidase domain-containing protein [Rhodospirillales bacterium]